MHAASVHPEPGSNSRINCIHHSFRCHKSSELSLALYFALSMCPVLTGHLFKGFPRFRTRSFACTSISCCSIVNDPSGFRFCFCHHCLADSRCLADSLTIISLSFPFVKGFSKLFEKVFSTAPGTLSASPLGSRSRSAPYYTTLPPLLSRGFFNFFGLFQRNLSKSSTATSMRTAVAMQMLTVT